MKKIVGIILSVLMIFSLAACSNNTGSQDTNTNDKLVTLNQTSARVELGDEINLELKEDGVKVTSGVIWASTNANVASVYNGRVTTLSIGQTIIQAVYNDVTYTCNITVVEKELPDEVVLADIYGNYNANPYLSGMSMNMAFQLEIIQGSQNDSFKFKRGDSIVGGSLIPGETLAEGKVTVEGVNVKLTSDSEDYTLQVSKTINYVALHGIMSTGAPGKTHDMTFKKILTNPNATAEKEIAHTFVGSNSKPAGPMGVMSGTHIIELYRDNTLEIYCGFYAGTGNRRETYNGTYTLAGNSLSFDYIINPSAENGFDAPVKKHVDATITNGMFRAGIFLCATTPDDGTQINGVQGYSYYEIQPTAISGADKVYAGTRIDKVNKDPNEFNVYILRMYGIEDFDVVVKTNNFEGVLSGKYKVIEDPLEDNMIEFKYDKHMVRDGKITDDMVKTNSLTKFSTNYSNEYVIKLHLSFGGVAQLVEVNNMVNCK